MRILPPRLVMVRLALRILAVLLRVVLSALQALAAHTAQPLVRKALNTTKVTAKNALNQQKNALQKNVVVALPVNEYLKVNILKGTGSVNLPEFLPGFYPNSLDTFNL